MTPTLSRGSPIRIHAPGHHRHGQTGYIASLDVQDEGEPHHLVAVGGVFVALPAAYLVPVGTAVVFKIGDRVMCRNSFYPHGRAGSVTGRNGADYWVYYDDVFGGRSILMAAAELTLETPPPLPSVDTADIPVIVEKRRA